MSKIKKITAMLFLTMLIFVAGCEAFRMSPDAWLDPQRWDHHDQQAYSKAIGESENTW